MLQTVVQMSGDPHEGQLVAITQYEAGLLGPPLAIGRMAMPGSKVRGERTGKAVNVLHFHRDKLWEMGDKSEPPSAEPMPEELGTEDASDEDKAEGPKADTSKRDEPVEDDTEHATPPPPTDVDESVKAEEVEHAEVDKAEALDSKGMSPLLFRSLDVLNIP